MGEVKRYELKKGFKLVLYVRETMSKRGKAFQHIFFNDYRWIIMAHLNTYCSYCSCIFESSVGQSLSCGPHFKVYYILLCVCLLGSNKIKARIKYGHCVPFLISHHLVVFPMNFSFQEVRLSQKLWYLDFFFNIWRKYLICYKH